MVVHDLGDAEPFTDQTEYFFSRVVTDTVVENTREYEYASRT
jgi:hypothetical protein